MNFGTFAERLSIALGSKNAHSLSVETGLADSLIRKYLDGSVPGLEKAAILAKALNVRLEWLATGEEPMRPGQSTSATEVAPNSVDTELMARLTDGISRVYKDLGSRISPADAVRIAAPEYEKIVTLAAEPAERLVMVKLAVENVRRELQAANDAASRKQQG